MATKIDIKDLVTCPICFEQFRNPKSLPCFHTFCHPCLKSYIIKQLSGDDLKSGEFQCPVCRRRVTVTDTNVSSEKIADTMPGNHFITLLIGRLEVSDKGQDIKLCDPCNYENEKTVGVSWCIGCSESLCENCVKYHKQFNRKTKHEIIPIQEAQKEKAMDLIDTDEPCMKHQGKVLEVYCLDHKEICCVICLTTSHRKCEHVSTFEDMVMGPNSTAIESVDQFAECLNEIEKKTFDLEIETESNLYSLDNRHNEISKQVTTTVQKAKDKLDQLQCSFLTSFQHKHKEESIKLIETKEKIGIFLQNVKRGQKFLQTVREHGSPKQVFLTKEKLKMQLKYHMDSLKGDIKDGYGTDYTLNADKILTSILDTLNPIPEVDVKRTSELSTCVNGVCGLLDFLFKAEEEPIEVPKIEVYKEDRINPGGEITGGVFLPDGRIVLCCYTNRKIQIYDKALKYLFEVKCNGKNSKCICLISPSEIIVSVSNQSYLKKYEIQQDTLKEIGSIPCKYEPWGLAATKDKIIVGYKHEVDVMSMSGYVVLTFARSGGFVSYVAVSVIGNLYYVDGTEVVCKTMDGKEARRFSDSSLKGLSGIAIDKNENVYVCGYNSNNVRVFSPDGRISKVLISNIGQPFGIGLDSTGTRLYVGTAGEGCHFYRIRK